MIKSNENICSTFRAKRKIYGEDCERVEGLWEEMYNESFNVGAYYEIMQEAGLNQKERLTKLNKIAKMSILEEQNLKILK